MLERQRFWLRWTGPGPACDVLDGDAAVVVGHVRPIAQRGWSGWLDRWFGPGVLEACELTDDSLVFTLHRVGRLFGPGRWLVRDSLGTSLGWVGPAPAASGRLGLLVNRHGRAVASLGHPGPDGHCPVRDNDGRLLASTDWPAGGNGWLEIATALAEEPFLKMLLLAALIWLADDRTARRLARSGSLRPPMSPRSLPR